MPTTIDGTTGVSLIQTSATPFLVGQVCLFAMNSAPSGFLKCNGAAVSRTTYSALFAVVGTTYGAGDGSTTFNVPDLRGEFLRSLDDGRGIDPARAIGSAQSDAIRNITGTVTGLQYPGTASMAGAFALGTNAGNKAPNADTPGGTATFDASRVVPTAAENRPRNVALLSCIFTGVA